MCVWVIGGRWHVIKIDPGWRPEQKRGARNECRIALGCGWGGRAGEWGVRSAGQECRREFLSVKVVLCQKLFHLERRDRQRVRKNRTIDGGGGGRRTRSLKTRKCANRGFVVAARRGLEIKTSASNHFYTILGTRTLGVRDFGGTKLKWSCLLCSTGQVTEPVAVCCGWSGGR